MSLPSRLAALNIYAKRILYWFFTSTPYLSGDAFSLLADHRYRPPKFWSKVHAGAQINKARTVFVPSHFLEEFLECYESSFTCKTLLLGNSDRNFKTFDLTLPPGITKCYVQNLDFHMDRFEILPIGLENRRLGKNGTTRFYRGATPWHEKHNLLLIGPFSITHPEREVFTAFQSHKGPWIVERDSMDFKSFSRLSEKYKFVACPQGNGIDTHRFWETLYRGSIPVVLQSNWSAKIKALGVPVVELTSWDFDEISRCVELNCYSSFDPKKVGPLWIDYWKIQIN
jgi:hypothetical protein